MEWFSEVCEFISSGYGVEKIFENNCYRLPANPEKVTAGSSEQAGQGMTSETEQRTQGEDLGTVGDATLVEGGETFVPQLLDVGEDAGGVFKAEGGV